jgi:hypothetical protein
MRKFVVLSVIFILLPVQERVAAPMLLSSFFSSYMIASAFSKTDLKVSGEPGASQIRIARNDERTPAHACANGKSPGGTFVYAARQSGVCLRFRFIHNALSSV